MRRFFMLLFGAILGGGIGAIVIGFFAPQSQQALQEHIDRALVIARDASATRRRELEAELAETEEKEG